MQHVESLIRSSIDFSTQIQAEFGREMSFYRALIYQASDWTNRVEKKSIQY